MGYAQEKKEQDNKKKRIKICALFVCVLLGVLLALLGSLGLLNGLQYRVDTPKINARASGEMRMHFLNVGQGDCTLIELPDGKIAVIDSGNGGQDANQALLRHLHALDVETIDYLIITHVDSDHAGGVEELLKYKKVKRAFLPLVTGENHEYDKLLASVMEKDVPYYTACPPDGSRAETLLSVTDGEYPYTFAFLYPTTEMVDNGTANEETNAQSSVLWLDYQGTSTLFTGDAPETTEHKLILDDSLGLFSRYGVTLAQTEILKVSHHGSADATSQALLDYIHAETAVVSCGKDNGYQHPASEVIDRLTGAEIDVYRTDMQGTIVISVQRDGAYQTFSLN